MAGQRGLVRSREEIRQDGGEGIAHHSAHGHRAHTLRTQGDAHGRGYRHRSQRGGRGQHGQTSHSGVSWFAGAPGPGTAGTATVDVALTRGQKDGGALGAGARLRDLFAVGHTDNSNN